MPKGLEKHTQLTQQIIAACYEVHNALGPGLEERFYRLPVALLVNFGDTSVQIRRFESRD